MFTSIVVIYELEAGRGVGFSKKESQQKAAEEAMNKINKDKEFLTNLLNLKEEQMIEP